MAQTRKSGGTRTGRTSYTQTVNRRAQSAYVYGSAARDYDVRRQMEEEPRRRLSNETRKNRDKARHMNPGYVLFLVAALCVCGMILINYIQLQSELTNKHRQIAILESEVNSLKLSNDEEYSRITRSVDLDEIKRIAITELGMIYAEEGQIVPYNSVTNDYMRQVKNQGN